MREHIKILGVLHIVFSALGLLAAAAIFLIFGGIAALVGATDYSGDAHIAIPILGSIGALIFFFLLAVSLPGLIAGIGLLQFRPWARILTIVLSVIDLINVPFGTALGVYGLWVLLSEGTERLFEQAA
ncbi:MAG: hypothetical protein ACLP59_18160 [Bryobacteraceae bacterium]